MDKNLWGVPKDPPGLNRVNTQECSIGNKRYTNFFDVIVAGVIHFILYNIFFCLVDWGLRHLSFSLLLPFHSFRYNSCCFSLRTFSTLWLPDCFFSHFISFAACTAHTLSLYCTRSARNTHPQPVLHTPSVCTAHTLSLYCTHSARNTHPQPVLCTPSAVMHPQPVMHTPSACNAHTLSL